MANPDDPVIQTCTACGTLIDVSDEEPFALMHCPACGAAQRVRRTFDHFELQEILGAGGMGAVYRALDTNLNRSVALKLLRKEYSADQEFVRQFEKEAAITASINHPNVVKVYTAGQDHGLVYIAMELVDKGSLDDLMGLQGRVAEVQVLEVGIQTAQGLNAALQRGLIHRDVKPGNILFADAHTAKIVDFGLAVLQEHASTVAGEVWGTPYYVAPEKLDNSPEDFRSDMYSLGATLFHAVAGRPPFEAETASMVALKHLKSQAVSLQAFAPDVSSATAYVINKTLAKEPGERYQSYPELIEHLEYARNELLAASARGPAPKTRVVLEDADTAKAVSWITFAMVAVVVGGGVLYWVKRDSFADKAPQIAPRIEAARKANAGLEPKFKEARELLVSGKFTEAATALEQLAASPNVPQPLLNWITLHQGLALLVDGKEAEARPVFAQIKERGPYSQEGAESKMSAFFIDTADKLAGDTAVERTVAVNYQKSSYEAIALFLFALKDWQLGNFDEASALFRQFSNARPEAPYAWIADYRPLSDQFIAAYSEFSNIAEKLRKADTLEKKKGEIEDAKISLAEMKNKGRLAERLGEVIKSIEQSVAAEGEEQSKKVAAQDGSDAKALKEMRTQVAPLLLQYKYAEAEAAAKAATFSGDKARQEQAKLLKTTHWLATFKATLVADLNATPFPNGLLRKNGQRALGQVGQANATGVAVNTGFGTMSFPWAEISPDSILAMARSFIRPGLSVDITADRQWLCGVFAVVSGKVREGRELLVAASQAKPPYKDDLALFPE
jgi:predicted RNA-binding Zn-ribbon protein involved in translation (DUF1610 family)